MSLLRSDVVRVVTDIYSFAFSVLFTACVSRRAGFKGKDLVTAQSRSEHVLTRSFSRFVAKGRSRARAKRVTRV